MDIAEFAEKDRFAQHVGVELLEASEGRAKARMVIKEQHLNALDMVHGAAIFALADLAFAVAVNSYGPPAMAINVNISFVKGASEGVLTAEAAPVSVSSRLGTFMVRVTDEEGDLVALFQGMAYRRTPRTPRG